MNRERIDSMYKALGCTNTDIARCLGCAQSSISRVRSGNRDYTPSSKPVINFAEGVYIFADKNNQLNLLCDLCGCDNRDRGTLIGALISWLFNGESDKGGNELRVKSNKRRQKTIVFGKRLNAVMNLLELSNIRLAKKINIDTSIISRFRNGVRTPRPPISEILAKELLKQAAKSNRLSELAKMSETNTEVISDSDSAMRAFTAWLYSADDTPETTSIDTLLDNLDSFDAKPALPQTEGMPAIDSVLTEDVLKSTDNIYWGTEGLRLAVTRFLGTAQKQGGELWLYSDEDMDWMVGDKSFFTKWFALMVACIKRGVKIKIIHNVERGATEMISAIQSWLPLYMSGLIESYVCRRLSDARFSHTLFIHKGKAAVYASHVKGTQAMGRYEYITEDKTLEVLAEEYNSLLRQSAPLVKIHFEDYVDGTYAAKGNGHVHAVLTSLSLATMPRKLLNSVLDKNNVPAKDKKNIESFYEIQKRTLSKALHSGVMREFVVIPSDEDLFDGKARINLPLSIYPKELYYTPEDYGEHIKKIIKLHEGKVNYHIYLLPEAPFNNLQIVNTGSSIAVIRSQKPFAAFVFSEPLMVHSFTAYFNALKTKFDCDRNEVRERLKRFIR